MKLANVINKDVFEVRHGVELTPVGMSLPETLDEDQWNEIGDQVMRLGSASNWMLGDWWAYGEHEYGARKKWMTEQKMKRAHVKSWETLKRAGMVCRAFGMGRRRPIVSFEMHRELLGLPEAKQDKFLDRIEAGEIKTHKELRAQVSPAKKSDKKTRSLTVHMFLGTCCIENPPPEWHVVEDDHRENHQTITCTKCWSHSTGGETQFSKGNRNWTFACRCPESSRTQAIIEK